MVLRFIALCLVFALPALAAEKPAPKAAPNPAANAKELKPEEGPGNYALCLETARAYPQQGLELARRWQTLDGGEPADHCLAVAQIGVRLYHEAAIGLVKLGLESKFSPSLRAGLLAQAAQAYSLDDDLEHALEAQTAALKLIPVGTPAAAPVLVDRAVTQGELKKYAEAIEDLDAALALNPKNAEALAFRANAHRELKQYEAALKDANAALAVDAKSTDALLERGLIFRATGNAAAARSDWEAVIGLEPESASARAAKTHIAQLDAKPAP